MANTRSLSTTSTGADLRGGHQVITWAALQALPKWQRDLWEPESEKLVKEYSLYGDTYYLKPTELAPYVELPDGEAPICQIGVLREKRHLSPAHDCWESPFYERCEEVLTYYMRRIAESLADGRLDIAARIAGAAAHYIQDSGVPAHAADNGDMEFVRDYLPPPPGFEAFPIHHYTEKSCDAFLLDGYRPQLYGLSVEEAGANFVDRYVKMVLFARSLLFPLARSAYDGDEKTGQALRTQAAMMCAQVTADYLYNASCIGLRRFSAQERDALESLPLAPRWPYRMTAWAPHPYSEPGPRTLLGINLDMARKPVACQLLTGEPGHRARRFPNSLGAGAPFFYHYKLPPGVYSLLTGLVGVHASLGAQRPIDVRVETDGVDVFRDRILPGAKALAIKARIDGCRNLLLLTSGPKWDATDAEGNHVVWADLAAHKETSAS